MAARLHQRDTDWPWMRGYRTTRHWVGYRDPQGLRPQPLYSCDVLRMDARRGGANARQEDAVESDAAFIELFWQSRFYNGKAKNVNKLNATSCIQAWNDFVANYRQNPNRWRERLAKSRERHWKFSVMGLKLEIHRRCVAHRLPCAVRVELACPYCKDDDPKLPESAFDESGDSEWNAKVPSDIWELVDDLEARESAQPSSASVTDNTRSLSRARPSSGRARAPRYLPMADTQASARATTAYASPSTSGPCGPEVAQRSNVADPHDRSAAGVAGDSFSFSPMSPDENDGAGRSEMSLRSEVQMLERASRSFFTIIRNSSAN